MVGAGRRVCGAPPRLPLPTPNHAQYLRAMREYQAVILKLTRRAHDDEDALTDLLNERSRGGWAPTMMSQDAERLTIIFHRDAGNE
jgi:hypothetical protein